MVWRLGLVAWLAGQSWAAFAAYSFAPRGQEGFDVLVNGAVVAPIRLAANGALLANEVTTNDTTIRLSGLHTKNTNAVVFASDDYVSLTLPSGGSAPEPVVRFQLTFQSFHSDEWAGMFPSGQPAPFHFLACAMPAARVWHQRGWLNATPLDDRFPLLIDPHGGTPEIACSWNRNWGYICPLGGHPIPMIGLWDPVAALYVGYDFQDSRASTEQSERDVCTVYCWGSGTLSNFVALAYPEGGERFGQRSYPKAGNRLASYFSLVIQTNLPSTADPNEQFQGRLFARYTNALPRVPAMNDLAWQPGYPPREEFVHAVGPQVIYTPDPGKYFTNNTLQLSGFGGHIELPLDAWLLNSNSLADLRKEIERLLSQYAKTNVVGGDTCLYWQQPLEGAWFHDWGDTNVITLHNSEGFFAGRILVELYRYDLAHTNVHPEYLAAIDGVFNWAKHFVWTRGEFSDVPSSPFAVGVTLSTAFLLDYYFTFKDDPVRATNAPVALRLANTLIWRYLCVWAMDSNLSDGALDSAFLAEPNSGRDWASVGCANEMSWVLDAIIQVYVHTGDERLRYYLRGMLQRWHSLYRDSYEHALDAFGKDALSEGYGLYQGCGPQPGKHYVYGFTQRIGMAEPIGNSVIRVVGGAAACIAFDKGGTACDVADYRTDGNGACSFRVVSSLPGAFDLSFSYPFVNQYNAAITRLRGGTLSPLGSNDVRFCRGAPTSVYFYGVQDGDVLTVGSVSNAPPFTPDSSLVYDESAVQPLSSGPFVTLSITNELLLPQQWTSFHSFAGIVPGLHWAWTVPYQQRLGAASNAAPLSAPGAYAVLVAYSPPEDATLSAQPALRLADRTVLELNRTPVLAWRGWPTMFNRMVLLDYAMLWATNPVAGVEPQGCLVMGATAFMGDSNAWNSVEPVLSSAAQDFVQEENKRWAQVALQSGFAQLPTNLIAQLPALLPFDVPGPALVFACNTGLRNQWTSLSPGQLVDASFFNATRFPLAFYVGDDDYVATVNTADDGKEAVIQYLAGGGTLAVLSESAFPFSNACDPSDTPTTEPSPTDCLLPCVGLPLGLAFTNVPGGLSVLVNTQAVALPMVPPIFDLPQGGQTLPDRSNQRGRPGSVCLLAFGRGHQLAPPQAVRGRRGLHRVGAGRPNPLHLARAAGEFRGPEPHGRRNLLARAGHSPALVAAPGLRGRRSGRRHAGLPCPAQPGLSPGILPRSERPPVVAGDGHCRRPDQLLDERDGFRHSLCRTVLSPGRPPVRGPAQPCCSKRWMTFAAFVAAFVGTFVEAWPIRQRSRQRLRQRFIHLDC